ncbi:MAG TPA: 2-oxo acid dehydrogenase subunit E2, partial [Thermomicrobiales bacterium]|nr:2-oxo acid dehydrogenase subunit E2 [Thermomicrobiales bacterium]
MAVEIKVPPLGESLVDAVVGQWLKGEGDAVSRGETVVELETDKVNLDVTAAEDGVLSRIDKQEGDVVTVGETLGMVAAGEGSATASENGSSAQAEPEAAATVANDAREATTETESALPRQASEAAPAAGDTDGGRAAPAVRRLAEEHHIDLAALTGTGPGGRITREDVMGQVGRQPEPATPGAPAAPLPQPAPAPSGIAAMAPVADEREERIRLSRRRQTIAQRLVQAQQTAAMLTTFNEVDMSAVMEVRSRRKESFKERHGVGLGFMSFFTKAAIGALKAFPRVNGELRGDELILKHYYDIGIAVGVEEGLVVPVVRDADRKSFAEIERE